jgi:succinate-semialdehyde dehydrogenase/glutarate-semialdehyde dehydrogenase
MSKLISTNPFTEEINATFETLSREELSAKIDLAESAFQQWKLVPKSEKKALFLKLADIMEIRQKELAEIQTQEMGMLFGYSFGGIAGTIKLTRWFANNFETILANEIQSAEWMQFEYQYDPLGVIYGIAPWNFPFNQVLRAAIPNILAGNTTIYKHASNTPLAGEKIESLFREAGFPEGIYQNIFISSSESEYIIARDEIKWINITASEWAGRSIGALAWKYLKPSVLELGGNDAFIVASTNRLEEIAKSAIMARMSNNGQKCNSSKRFLVQEKDYEAFCEYCKVYIESLTIGDPMDPSTDVWPLARADLVDEIDAQVQKTISEWAILLTGGKKLDRIGYFYAPTILRDVTPEMTAYREEIFGPVLSIIQVKDIEEAIKLANHSDFGLCGCVYGNDEEELKSIARRIETGAVFINKPAASQPHLPFGGIKKSGYGKENGPDGLKAFTNKKVIIY